jgi:hypothetical protein
MTASFYKDFTDEQFDAFYEALHEESEAVITPEFLEALPKKFPEDDELLILLSGLPHEALEIWRYFFGQPGIAWWVRMNLLCYFEIERKWASRDFLSEARQAYENLLRAKIAASDFPVEEQVFAFLLFFGMADFDWIRKLYDQGYPLHDVFRASHQSRNQGWVEACLASGGDLDIDVYISMIEQQDVRA